MVTLRMTGKLVLAAGKGSSASPHRDCWSVSHNKVADLPIVKAGQSLRPCLRNQTSIFVASFADGCLPQRPLHKRDVRRQGHCVIQYSHAAQQCAVAVLVEQKKGTRHRGIASS